MKATRLNPNRNGSYKFGYGHIKGQRNTTLHKLNKAAAALSQCPMSKCTPDAIELFKLLKEQMLTAAEIRRRFK